MIYSICYLGYTLLTITYIFNFLTWKSMPLIGVVNLKDLGNMWSWGPIAFLNEVFHKFEKLGT